MTAGDETLPTTDEVRHAYLDSRDFLAQVAGLERPTDEESSAAFDRWLAAHDAEVREAVARLVRATPATQMEGVAASRSQDYYDGVADGIYGTLGLIRGAR